MSDLFVILLFVFGAFQFVFNMYFLWWALEIKGIQAEIRAMKNPVSKELEPAKDVKCREVVKYLVNEIDKERRVHPRGGVEQIDRVKTSFE